jgi:hypothetical protein
MSGSEIGGTAGARLRDQELQPVTVVRSSDAAVQPPAVGRWLVIVDDDGAPVATVNAGRRNDSSIVVADADLPVTAALLSPAFDEVDPDTGVVVVDKGRIVGIWAGENLARELFQSQTRGLASGTSLPGFPQIPLIRHTCAYVENSVACDTTDSFQRKPAVMPRCLNKKHLSTHDFVW